MASASMPLQYDRLYNGPIDTTEIHENLEAATVYAQSPVAYPGQTIKVKVDENNWKSYTINEDKTLTAAITSDDLLAALSWVTI